jgi:HK97 family phage major capsid protein
VDVKELKNELTNVYAQFKETVDERLNQTAEKGYVDGLVEQKYNTLNEQIDKIKEAIKSVEKSQNKQASIAQDENLDVQHKEAFLGWARKGNEGDLRSLQTKAMKLAVEDNEFVIPSLIEAEVQRILQSEVEIRNYATVRTASTEDYRRIVNSRGAQSGWVGEKAARSATTAPGLEEVKPSFGEIYANPQITQKMLDDAAFNVDAELVQTLGEEFAEQEDFAFISGDGTNKPKGILAYTLSTDGDADRNFGVIQKISDAFDYSSMLALMHSAKKGYRRNGVWVMNRSTLAAARSLADANGNLIWHPDHRPEGLVDTLFGFPVIESDEMPDAVAGETPVIFGDLSRGYLIVDVAGVRVLRDPYTNKPYVGFYSTKRVGGAVSDSNAIKVLEIPAG